MRLKNIITDQHTKSQRNYIARMLDSKSACMDIASLYDFNYWDGKRCYGYGGYKYIPGYWNKVAKDLINIYQLKDGDKVLDVGCGKGFLLFELKCLLPNLKIIGFDISEYALLNSKEEIRGYLSLQSASSVYPLSDLEVDLVISINTLHNLCIEELQIALNQIERVGKKKYICVESYRNSNELFNLECWALTCKSFFSSKDWEWVFNNFKYSGDYEFIYFE
jgi:ubiquinone/menaquinone biosynthesis C-methylase UbiE